MGALHCTFIDIIEKYSLNDVSEDEMRVGTKDLQTGMALSRNIYSSNGVILLKKNHILDSGLIDKIVNFEHLADETLDIYICR